MVGTALLVVGVALSLAAWTFLFRRPPQGIWPRTWITAVALTTFAVVAMAVDDRLDTVLGPVGVLALAAGLVIGGAWLACTHIGHRLFCRFVPGFLDQITELYSLREGDRVLTMVGPVVALAVAEEIFFRGFVQGRIGLVGAIVVYTGVQLVAGKWALTLAGLLGAVVWGGLAWWTEGLVAPVVAHVLWTGMLTFVLPLRGCGNKVGAADAAPMAHQEPTDQSGDQTCDRSPEPGVVEPGVVDSGVVEA